jgi:hypothetical protein
MKPAYLAAGLLALYIPWATAVDFNKDALKSMQEEGHKIVAEEQGFRAFKVGGQCLHDNNPGKTGAPVVTRKCDGKSKNQNWRADDQGRLVGQGGHCLAVQGNAGAGAVTQKCGSSKAQKWQRDKKQRFTNGGGLCLQGKGGKVTSAKCSDAADQVWK